jgi:chemotaxis protein MotA
MDKAYMIGFGVALGVLVLGVESSGVAWGALYDLASIFITVGGAMATTMMQNSFELTMGIHKIYRLAWIKNEIDINRYVLQIVSLSEIARREGILALEDHVDKLDSKFLTKALQMIIDGTDPEIAKRVMRIEIEALEARHGTNRAWFETLATMGPAFGMLGTLIGLVGMLSQLGGDTSGLGKAMAAALITTLYGSFLANVFATPTGNKLKGRTGDEVTLMNMLLEGVMSIQAGENPKVIMDKLLCFVDPAAREVLIKQREAEGGSN